MWILIYRVNTDYGTKVECDKLVLDWTALRIGSDEIVL